MREELITYDVPGLSEEERRALVRANKGQLRLGVPPENIELEPSLTSLEFIAPTTTVGRSGAKVNHAEAGRWPQERRRAAARLPQAPRRPGPVRCVAAELMGRREALIPHSPRPAPVTAAPRLAGSPQAQESLSASRRRVAPRLLTGAPSSAAVCSLVRSARRHAALIPVPLSASDEAIGERCGALSRPRPSPRRRGRRRCTEHRPAPARACL